MRVIFPTSTPPFFTPQPFPQLPLPPLLQSFTPTSSLITANTLSRWSMSFSHSKRTSSHFLTFASSHSHEYFWFSLLFLPLSLSVLFFASLSTPLHLLVSPQYLFFFSVTHPSLFYLFFSPFPLFLIIFLIFSVYGEIYFPSRLPPTPIIHSPSSTSLVFLPLFVLSV